MTSGPNLADFSKSATKRAVLKASIEHPVTLYSAGIGMLGALAMGLFGAFGIPLAAAVGGFGLGLGSWLVNYYLRGGRLADRHIQKLYEALHRRREETLEGLDAEFKSLAKSCKNELRDYTKQARAQLEMSEERFETLKKTLDAKLKPGELTYGRYLGAAEQVYLSVLDNLSAIATLLGSACVIDPKYISSRIEALRELPNPQEADRQELETLSDRSKLLQEQSDKVNAVLTKNEVAITQMDRLGAALAEVKILKGEASVDLDTAIKEMEELALRARRYEQ